MKKILILILVMIPLFTGCSLMNDETTAAKSEFGMNFKSIDNENKIAIFEINGLPNKEEFKQVDKVIIDSMKKQNVSDEYIIKVNASTQDSKKDPVFGTAKYNDDKLIDNKIKNITSEEYIELTTVNKGSN